MATFDRRSARMCCTRGRLGALAIWGLCPVSGVLGARSAQASSFSARLAAGPAFLHDDTRRSSDESSGAGLATQLDLGLRLLPALAAHASVIYDYSSWMHFAAGPRGNDYVASMLGVGLGASARFAGFALGAVAGGQFTFFPQSDDPASGPNGASFGPFVSATLGYEWALAGFDVGVHGLARYRSSQDETNSIVYDPSGYHLGLVLSIGIEGTPLLEPAGL